MSQTVINPFDEGGYDLATMTAAVNLTPNNYGRVRLMGVFVRHGDTTQRVVILDLEDGVISLLPSVPVGGPATQAKRGGKRSLPFIIPHVPYDDRILASDLQGQRAAGEVSDETLERVMLKRLTSMRNSHAITEEFMSVNALKGKIIDGSGIVLIDLFAAFGGTQKSVPFELSNPDANVDAKCRAIVRHIEDNLMGDTMTGVHCFCDETFFDAFIDHDSVKEKYLGHSDALRLAAGGEADPRKGFVYGGITFEEYRGKAPKADGTGTVKFIDEGEAHFFPVGTSNTFELYDAPADFLETVNTPGLPVYAKQVMDADGKYVKILTESNPLPLCKRPAVLVKGTK